MIWFGYTRCNVHVYAVRMAALYGYAVTVCIQCTELYTQSMCVLGRSFRASWTKLLRFLHHKHTCCYFFIYIGRMKLKPFFLFGFFLRSNSYTSKQNTCDFWWKNRKNRRNYLVDNSDNRILIETMCFGFFTRRLSSRLIFFRQHFIHCTPQITRHTLRKMSRKKCFEFFLADFMFRRTFSRTEEKYRGN